MKPIEATSQVLNERSQKIEAIAFRAQHLGWRGLPTEATASTDSNQGASTRCPQHPACALVNTRSGPRNQPLVVRPFEYLEMDSAALRRPADTLSTPMGNIAVVQCLRGLHTHVIEGTATPNAQDLLVETHQNRGRAAELKTLESTVRGEHCSPRHTDPPQVSRVQAGICDESGRAGERKYSNR